MSFLYGLESLIQKYQLKSQEGRVNMNPNAENLFEVVHKKELLNKEKELFLREHLFKDRGGFEFNKNKGLPDIKAYNKHLPSVLRDNNNETANEIEEENEIGEIASDITNITDINEEKYDSEDEDGSGTDPSEDRKVKYTKKEIISKLKDKTKSREDTIKEITSGSGVPIFYNKDQDLKDVYEESPYDEEESTRETNDIGLTLQQKNVVSEILGDELYNENTKPKKAIGILIYNTEGTLTAFSPSIRELKKVKDANLMGKISKAKISKYGVYMKLDDDSVVVSVPKSIYNKVVKEAQRKYKESESES
jgi:hypothetical protein